jgi:hypothetical protein
MYDWIRANVLTVVGASCGLLALLLCICCSRLLCSRRRRDALLQKRLGAKAGAAVGPDLALARSKTLEAVMRSRLKLVLDPERSAAREARAAAAAAAAGEALPPPSWGEFKGGLNLDFHSRRLSSRLPTTGSLSDPMGRSLSSGGLLEEPAVLRARFGGSGTVSGSGSGPGSAFGSPALPSSRQGNRASALRVARPSALSEDAVDRFMASQAAALEASLPGSVLGEEAGAAEAGPAEALEGRSLLVLPPGSGLPEGMKVVPLED